MRHLLRRLILTVLLLSSVPIMASAQTTERCFVETGFCISGRIGEFWEKNGGLPVFGFPIGTQQQEQIEGNTLQVQRFQRNRLELHPENQPPYDVLLGRLGADRLGQQGRDWQAVFAKSTAQAGCRFFPETGHNVCGTILKAWRANGLELDGRRGKTEAENLALFGLPLSELVTETSSDGKEYQLQWFERARFELHPENQPPYDVLLGLLGSEVAAAPIAQPVTPTPTAAECAPVAAPTHAVINTSCVRGGDLFVINAQGYKPGESVDLYAQTAAGEQFDIVVYAGDAAVRADGAYTLKAALPSGIATGTYAIYIHGNKSGFNAIAPIVVSAGPPTGIDYSVLPASTDADAQPSIVPRTVSVTFGVRNFPSGNRVGVYLTFVDDGSVSGAPFTVGTDRNGGIKGGLRLQTEEEDRYGLYVATFEVLATGQKAFAYLRIVPK